MVNLNSVSDVAEVAAAFAIAVYKNSLTSNQGSRAFGDDGSIVGVGLLARAEETEEAHTDRVQAIKTREHFCIELVDVFGQGEGIEGSADFLFVHGQCEAVQIGTAGGVGEALNPCIACRHQHVQKIISIALFGEEEVINSASHLT